MKQEIIEALDDIGKALSLSIAGVGSREDPIRCEFHFTSNEAQQIRRAWESVYELLDKMKSNPKSDGGSAFPIPSVGTGDPCDGMTTGQEGMTLRDFFAAHALALSPNEGTMANAAIRAYGYADAMIEVRSF